jgi:hypothetical protein
LGRGTVKAFVRRNPIKLKALNRTAEPCGNTIPPLSRLG